MGITIETGYCKDFQYVEEIALGIKIALNKLFDINFKSKLQLEKKDKNKEYYVDRDSFILFPASKEDIIVGDEACILIEKKI